MEISGEISMSPESGREIFDNIFNKVDLPEPFPPIIPNTSPLLTEKLRELKTLCPLYDFDKLFTEIIKFFKLNKLLTYSISFIIKI